MTDPPAADPSLADAPLAEAPASGMEAPDRGDRLADYPPRGSAADASPPPASDDASDGVSLDPLEVMSRLPTAERSEGSVKFLGAQLSPELEQLLAAASERVESGGSQSSIPSPDEELDLLLPPELLAALDEPLDAEDEGGGESTGTPAGTGGSSPGRRPATIEIAQDGGGTSPPGAGAGLSTAPSTYPPKAGRATTDTGRQDAQASSAVATPAPPVDPAYGHRESSFGLGNLGRSSRPPGEERGSASRAPRPSATPRPHGDEASASSTRLDFGLRPHAPFESSFPGRPLTPVPASDEPSARDPRLPFPYAAPLRGTERPVTTGPQSRPGPGERRFEASPDVGAWSRSRPHRDDAPWQAGPGVERRLEEPPVTARQLAAPVSLPLESAPGEVELGHGSRPPAASRRPSPSPLPQRRSAIPAVGSSPPAAVEPEQAEVPAVLGEGDALRVLARAVALRASGSLALGAPASPRRIVLHDGDIVTAGSGSGDETLVAFLIARGDLPRDVGGRLAGKLPPFGRHAGAALIAHGHLGQDDLWPVLRAHAEWIIGRALLADEGTCELEADPPGRLKAEPNVFGGATGAEVLIETMRRVVPPELAQRRLGGSSVRLDEGPRNALLGECALRRDEEERVRGCRGRTLAEVAQGGEAELATVLYGLVALGVLDTLAPVAAATPDAPAEDLLDDEVLRARVKARLALVEDGDYFALLGVPRDATGYEIRRAYLALRRTFEPARLRCASTADLALEVRLIVDVLDEAFEILREPQRRERYRRAIEAGPP